MKRELCLNFCTGDTLGSTDKDYETFKCARHSIQEIRNDELREFLAVAACERCLNRDTDHCTMYPAERA